jgi:hypothetical protein
MRLRNWPPGETEEKLRLTVTFQEQRGWNFRDKMRLKVTPLWKETMKKGGETSLEKMRLILTFQDEAVS